MMRIWCIIAAWVVLAPWGRAENASIPIEPISGSIAPYVDKDGYVNPIISLGQINFGGGVTLPLVLNFSSALRIPSPEFGQGWECPLFDARSFDVQQNIKQVETLGGKSRYFIHDQRTDTWRHIYTDNWKGFADGDRFEIVYKTGCKFVFDKGLISSLTTPDGRTILWNRSGSKLVSMQESGKTPALQIVYDKLGFAKQILLNPNAVGKARAVFSLSSNLVYAGINRIDCFNGRIISFNRSHDENLNQMVSWTDTLHLPITLTWDAKTGKILSDNDHAYRMEEMEKTNTWPRMIRRNIHTGGVESYYFDEKRGTTDEILSDGTKRHIEMIQAPGPNYKTVRLIQDTIKGKTYTILRRAFDGQGRLLLEAIGSRFGREQVSQYTYDEAGHLTSFVLNGREIWHNIYDPVSGQLKERELPLAGIKMAFEQLPDGQVRESIQKGTSRPTATKVLASGDWKALAASLEAN